MFKKISQWLKPISISLSPNTERDDILLSFKLLFGWWSAKNESLMVVKLEEEFKKYLGVKYAIAFNSGRSSLMAILNSLKLEKGSEILLQAFTCNAVPNPVIWSGLKPVFVDCDEKTFNIDLKDLKRKITPRSRAVIIQHTFGLPADIDEISKICKENNLTLIEDCAHSLDATYKEKKAGTFGKASFFSFSRDKVISSVYGGMAATNDETLAQKLRQRQGEDGPLPLLWEMQQLLHPILMNFVILPTYRIAGKYLLIIFQWLHILSKAVHWKEKRGMMPNYFSKAMSGKLALLALNQLKKINRFNEHRRKIAKIYSEGLKKTSFELPTTPPDREHVFLRFTVKHPEAHKIIRKAWRNNLLIGDWYTSPIAPFDTKIEKIGYKSGSCPKAEALSKQTLNLPTHINVSEKQAEEIIIFLKNNGN